MDTIVEKIIRKNSEIKEGDLIEISNTKSKKYIVFLVKKKLGKFFECLYIKSNFINKKSPLVEIWSYHNVEKPFTVIKLSNSKLSKLLYLND